MKQLKQLKRSLRLFMLVGLSFCCSWGYAKPVTIELWHSLAGQLGDTFNTLVDGFNQSQNDYVIHPVYKGEYTESLMSFAAAFRAKKAPSIIQVYEVGTASMLYPQGIIKPLSVLMKEQHIHLPVEDFFPLIRARYSKNGQLQAMPFNNSVPVIYYNKDKLAALGITDATFPKTWQAIEELAPQLQKAGYACIYTSAYPAWIHIEAFAALHGLSLDEPLSHQASIVEHLTRLRRWQSLHYFTYGGRANDATALFTSGHCAFLTQSSGSYIALSGLLPFRLGVASLPMDEKVSTVRNNNALGGAALWTTAGQSPRVERGIALFYAYIAEPAIQLQWYQTTGYIPLGVKGVYQSLKDDKTLPTLAIAEQDLDQLSKPLSLSHGIAQNQIRNLYDDVLEGIFSGLITPLHAMQEMVGRTKKTLQRFSDNTGYA